MNIYHCKCGKQFSKSSSAGVTGYIIDENDTNCCKCPFKNEVTQGYPPVFSRYECRAGSVKPNHTDSWSGNLEDKTNLHIKSLNHEFLENIRLFCISDEGIGITGASYNADLEDCRRQLSITVEQNRKGINSKNIIVDKFFKYKTIECEKDNKSLNSGSKSSYEDILKRINDKKISIESILNENLVAFEHLKSALHR